MRDLILGVVLGGAVLAGLPGWGQTHRVAKPQQVVRAVGVYEWTGDMAQPAASRLIPVSLFIEGRLEDAGVYLARPVPFALLTGNVYELQDAGVERGTLELVYARHLQTASGDYTDGWFGYGSFQAVAAEKKGPALRASKTLGVIATSSEDSGRPHLSQKTDAKTTDAKNADAKNTDAQKTDAQKTDGDAVPAAPAVSSSPAAGASAADSVGGSESSSGAKADAGGAATDPDRPTMKRSSSDGSAGDSGAGAGSAPADDPDRPTLKRHSVEEAKKAQQAADAVASVSGVGSLNDDPNRPKLHYGKPASAMTETDLPKLVGMPPDLHQMVAVSDAAARDPHEFARVWEDAAERAAVLGKMEAMARAQLAAYGGVAAAPAVQQHRDGKPALAAKRGRAGSAAGADGAPGSGAGVALMDEVLKGYTLSYGGDPTYVYMAHTAGTGAALHYVTVVAQADGMGGLKAAIASVTDGAHLDRTPRMKFVDVVDAEASNRASLLFELRGQSSRQFALYRVIAARAEQIFLSGTMQ